MINNYLRCCSGKKEAPNWMPTFNFQYTAMKIFTKIFQCCLQGDWNAQKWYGQGCLAIIIILNSIYEIRCNMGDRRELAGGGGFKTLILVRSCSKQTFNNETKLTLLLNLALTKHLARQIVVINK